MYQRQTSRDRRSLLVAVFLAIGIVGYFGFRSAPEPPARGACVTLNVAASQEKSALLTELATTFSKSGVTSSG